MCDALWISAFGLWWLNLCMLYDYHLLKDTRMSLFFMNVCMQVCMHVYLCMLIYIHVYVYADMNETIC